MQRPATTLFKRMDADGDEKTVFYLDDMELVNEGEE